MMIAVKNQKLKQVFYPLMTSIIVILLFGVGWWLLKDAHIPVLMPSGEVANQQKDLIIFTVLLALIIVVPVFAMLFIFMFKFRETSKKSKYRPENASNAKLEILWWGIPIAIVILLSVVTWITSHSLDPYKKIESSKPTLEIEVVALQWKWLFIYPDESVATINDLTIPIDRPVHFKLSADAPMSSFWVPSLGSQIYSMNAMSSQLNLIANEKGVFKGYNANINGQGYARMVFDVNVVDDSQFEQWHSEISKSSTSLDKSMMKKLTQQSIEEQPVYMKLTDKNIYSSVIMKYMNGTGGNAKPEGDGSGKTEGAPEPFDEAINGNQPAVEPDHMKMEWMN